MSDPQPLSLDNKPKRAEPLQPDRPSRGDKDQTREESDANGKTFDATLEEQQERNQTAHENVTQGY